MAPLIRANSLYTIVNGPSWTQAEANSVKLGGHLVTISNAEEYNWILNTYSAYQNLNTDWWYKTAVWIGLTDSKQEGIWHWVSNEPSSWVPTWAAGMPDQFAGNPENYASLYLAETQHWRPWLKGELNDLMDSWNNLQGIAEIPLTSSITFSSTPKEGAGLFITSINLSAGTTSSGNLAEGATVYWKVSGITADDLATGALTGSGIITNGKLDLQHSLKTDADTGEKVEVSVFSDAGMTQQVGTQKSEAILESSNTSTAAARKIVARGNSLYTIVDGPTWTEAESNAAKLGGHLTTINDSSENQLVYSQFKDQGVQEYWIGYNDANTEGQWIWTSGETSTYQNWWNNGPQNPQSLENGIRDFAAIYTNNPTSGTGGTWGYTSNANGNITRGIAEIPFIRRGDSAYVIVQGPSWEEAEANAIKLGGHLVTINDAEEWSWFKSEYSPAKGYAYPESYDFYPNGEVQLWVGINDIASEGQYR